MYERVVVATDGSATADRAVAVALDLAERFDATVHALSVVDADRIESSPEAVRADLRNALDERGQRTLDALTDRDGGITTAVRTGSPGPEIVDYARSNDADLVALGTRGRHGPGRLLLGSVAEHVVRTCPIPVLTVRDISDD